MEETREQYTAPSLEEWGSIEELTQVGLTRPGQDTKEGSVLHSQGQ